MLYTKSKSLLDDMSTADAELSDQEPEPATLLAHAAYHASEGAKILRHHRETYGITVIAPSLWQTSIISAFTLLQVMALGNVQRGIMFEELHSRYGPYNAFHIESAFMECFRFLLGSGLQHMLARGIVRMLQHTGRQLAVELPSAATQMLALAEGSAWSPSNVCSPHAALDNQIEDRLAETHSQIHQISSIYPNLAIRGSDAENASMEMLLRRWESLDIAPVAGEAQ